MSKSNDTADEPKSPTEILLYSTDKLAKHASDTVEAITESLSAADLVETGAGTSSSWNGAEHSGQQGSVLSAEGRDGPKGETGPGGGPDIRPQGVDGHTGEGSRTGVVITGHGVGTVAEIAGDYAGGHRPTWSNSASAALRAPGEVNQLLERNFPHDAQVVQELLPCPSSTSAFSEADRRESFEIRRGGSEFLEETDNGESKTLEIFAFSSSGPHTVAGQEKRPDTLANYRWKKAYQFVKKQNAMKKKALSSPMGTGATLDGNALGFLSIHSWTRRTLFSYLYNEKAEYLLFGIIVSHLLVLVLKAECKWVTNFHPTDKTLNIADIALTSVYTVECVCRIITLGFVMSPHAYLRSNYNIVDFVIVIDSWVHIIRTLVFEEDAFLRLAVLRVFRALLVLRNFSFIGDVLAILDAVAKTIPPLKFMAMIMMMFIVCYSSLGEAYFAFTLTWSCKRKVDGELTYPQIFCAPKVRSDNIHKIKGACPAQQGLVCTRGKNPNYGITNFENVGAIYLMIIQIISFEGWTLIMLETRKTSNSSGSDAFFVIMVIFGGYFLVNVLIAAVSGVFLRVRQEHQILLRKYRRDKAFSFANAINMASLLNDVITTDISNLSWSQRLSLRTTKLSRQVTRSFIRESSRVRSSIFRIVDWRDPNSFMRRISSFGVTELENVGEIPSRNLTYRLSFSRSLSNGARFGRSLSRNLSFTVESGTRKLSSICWIIVHSKVFKYGVLFAISFNTAFMCTISTKASRRRVDAVITTQIVMVGIFWMEQVIRFLAVGLYEFVDEQMNVVDVMVLIFTTSSLIFNSKVPNILPVRLLRWFYVKRSRKEKTEGEGTPILVSILRSSPAVFSVFFFFLMIIFIVSIFSAELWGAQVYLTPKELLPRANYNTLPQAMLLWFSVSTGESWVNQMWNVLRPGMKNRWAAPVLFVPYYILTAIFIVNLIIAAILEETELTDYQKKLIQKREHVKWLQVKHNRRLSSTRSADWLLGIFEGFKGIQRRMSSMRITSLSIRPSSRLETPAEQTIQDIVQPTASSSQLQSTQVSEGSTQTAREITLQIPSTAPVEPGMRFSSFGGVQTSGPLPRMFPHEAVDNSGPAVDDKSKAWISRRSSASVLSSMAPVALQAPSQRRLSLASDGMFVRSGFKGPLSDDGGKKTALQAALLVVATEHAVAAGAVVAKQAEGQLKSKVSPETGAYRRKSGSRVSFLLSDFEGISPVGERATPWWMKDRSLFLFQPENKIRLVVTKMVEHEAYRWWQVKWCFWGTWVMVEINAHGEIAGKLHFLNYMDYGVFIVFLMDLILKSVAYGFLLTRDAYLEDPYNWVDLWNLICHGLYLKEHKFVETEYFAKASLILMAFRPYRFIPRFQGLRTLSSCVCRTFPAVGQVFLFSVVVYVIFALIGMQLFNNKFRSCTDPTVRGHVDCVGMFRNDVGLLAPRTWINPPFHFDAFGEAMLALFVCSTFDNWLEYFLYTAMDITGIERSPRQNASPANAIYFVCFICIGGFFILRMVLGVLIDQFGLMSGTKLLTERQKLWKDTNRLIQTLGPIRLPTVVKGMWIRRYCHKIVYNRVFEWVVILYVSANFVVSAAFVLTPTGPSIPVPVILKLRDWWYDKWNVLELYIILNLASLRFQKAPTTTEKQMLNFFLAAKIFRIVRYLHGLRTALVTVIVSLPSMLDITMLMGITLFALAQIGTQVFFYTKEGICIRNGGENSFETWLNSFIIMLQLTTLDNWSCLMTDITRSPPYCIPSGSTYASECGFPVWGIVYMILCICLTTYIFGNLFVAKVLDSITFGLLSEQALVTPGHLQAYRLLWAGEEFDRKCTGCIPHHKVKAFLIQLGYPLGGKRHGFIKWYSRIEYEIFHFRSEKGVPFQALLETIVLYKIGSRGLELPVRIEREKHIQGIYQHGAAMKIQGLVRGFLQRRRNKRGKLEDKKPDSESPDHTKEDDDRKRYSANPDDPPDIIFSEDPTLARQGIARPPRPPRASAPTDVDRTRQEAVAKSATPSLHEEGVARDETGSASSASPTLESSAPWKEPDLV